MKNKKLLLIIIFLSIEVLGQSGGSLGISDARSAGMGNVYSVTSRGVYAIGRNPANLALNTNHNFEIATLLPVPNANGSVGSDFISVSEYNYFFTGDQGIANQGNGKYLTEDDKSRLRSLFYNGSSIASQFNIDLLSFSINTGPEIGSFAFSVKDNSAVRSTLPVDFIDLVLYGNDIDRTYSFEDTDFNSWYLRDYSLSYAREINRLLPNLFKRLSIGATVKYVQGFWYAGIDKIGTSLTTDKNDYKITVDGNFLMHMALSPALGINYEFEEGENNSSFSIFPQPVGTGYGMDLGLSGQINNVWAIGISVTDVGSIKWTKETAQYKSDSQFVLDDITSEISIDSLVDVLKGKGEYVDGFSTNMATALHMGVSCQFDKLLNGNFPGELLAVLEYNQGFNNLPSNSINPRISLGFEWKILDMFPIRTGFAFGGIETMNWTFGFGFDAGLLEFNLATKDINGLLNGNSARRVGVSMGSRWKF